MHMVTQVLGLPDDGIFWGSGLHPPIVDISGDAAKSNLIITRIKIPSYFRFNRYTPIIIRTVAP